LPSSGLFCHLLGERRKHPQEGFLQEDALINPKLQKGMRMFISAPLLKDKVNKRQQQRNRKNAPQPLVEGVLALK